MVLLLAAAFLLTAGGNGPDEIWGEALLDSADVFTAPDARSYVTGSLRSGEKVRVLARGGEGFLSIEPPAGSIDWIPEDALEITGRTATVIVSDIVVRGGCDGAKLPGPPVLRLASGATVMLQDRPGIILNHAGGPRTWRAIDPPPEDRRYVSAAQLRRVGPEAIGARTSPGIVRNVSQPAPVPDARFDDPDSLRREFRGLLAQPLEERDFRSLIERTQASLKSAKAPEAREALEKLSGELEIQERVASAARRFHSAVTNTRKVDRGIAGRPADPLAPRPAHDGLGLLLPSSKAINGTKVYALVDEPTGAISAYLQMPPGIDADALVGRMVGVDGDLSYNEALGGRVMTVRDVEAVD